MATKKEKNATFVGLFLFVGLLITGIMIAQFGRISSAFGGDYELHVTFGDASGLVKDSDVTYGGAKVGRVISNPRLNEEGLIEITISIKGDLKIPEGSTFSINAVSLLGDKSIAIRPPESPSDTYLQDGQDVRGADGAGLDGITSQAQDIATNANDAIKDVREMKVRMERTLDNADKMLVELTKSLKTVNTSVLTEENTKAIQASLNNIKKSSLAIQQTTQDLKPLFSEAKETIASVKKATKTAETTFSKASTQIDSLEPTLSELPETLANLKKASGKITGAADGAQQFIAKLNNSNGFIKTLTDDKEFQADTKSFVKNLKTHGILRYKDAETSKKVDPKASRFKGDRR